ncbi:Protein CBG22131 [Caenorhabditis briggsae]|uniref:Protein CBG22131 n=1 Tax=Caenorhabditis briggsae TaxID=6238 RepID=A8Y1L4_CAEBR|nr:Protein CBG22131 [Caenorhabditis briggsae]CAP38784.2 Protein CBG22131 [Caenorhabditis briggsae]
MKRQLTTRSLSLAPSPDHMVPHLHLYPTVLLFSLLSFIPFFPDATRKLTKYPKEDRTKGCVFCGDGHFADRCPIKETPLILNSSIDDRRDDDERRSRVNASPDDQSSRRSTSTRRSRSPSTQRSATPQKSSSTRRSSSSEHSSENSSPERSRPTAPPSPKRPRSRQSTPGSPEPKRRKSPDEYFTRRDDGPSTSRGYDEPRRRQDSNNGEDSDNGEGSDNSKDSDPEEESGDEESEQAPDYKEDNESIQPIEIEVEVLFGEDDGSNAQEEEEDIAIVIPPPEAERCSKMRMLAKYPKEDMTKGCVFCGDGHFADRCPVFPTAEARRQFLNNQDYCKRCLHRRGTGIHSCNDKRKCYYCHSSSHNSAVCSIPKSLTDHRQLRSSGYSRGGRQPSPDVKILEYPDPGEQYEHLQRKRDNRDNMDIRRGYNQDRRTKEDKDQRRRDQRDRHPTEDKDRRHQDHRDRRTNEDKDQSYQSGEPSAKRRGQ